MLNVPIHIQNEPVFGYFSYSTQFVHLHFIICLIADDTCRFHQHAQIANTGKSAKKLNNTLLVLVLAKKAEKYYAFLLLLFLLPFDSNDRPNYKAPFAIPGVVPKNIWIARQCHPNAACSAFASNEIRSNRSLRVERSHHSGSVRRTK